MLSRHGPGYRPLKMLMVLLALAACQTSQPTSTDQHQAVSRPQVIAATGTYTHQGTSRQFPPTIEGFERTELVRYDADAADVSATYRRSGPPGAALGTVYIYPAPWVQGGRYPDLTDRQLGGLCRGELEAAKAAVAQLHPDAKIIIEGGDVKKGDNARMGFGWVVYALTDEFEGRRQLLQSRLYVMCTGWSQWIFKFRLTAPERVDLDAVFRTLGQGMGGGPAG